MDPNDTKLPHSYFAPPGAVRVSAAALKMAREFDEAVRRATSQDDWIVTFDWAFARSVRQRPGCPTEDIGPGLDLITYARSDTPPEVIQRVEGVTFAIKIPSHIYNASTQRLIDVDETAFSKLVLR
jgi:hypothetical protein